MHRMTGPVVIDAPFQVLVRYHFQRCSDQGLCVLDDAVQLVLALKALRIDLVDILRTGRAGSEPAVCGHHLEPTNGGAVARRRGEHPRDFVACQLRSVDLPRRQLLQSALLLWARWRIDALIDRLTKIMGKPLIEFSRVTPRYRRHLCGEETHDDAILVGGPHRSVPPQE